MASDPKGAALGLHRFGYGPHAGSIAAIAPDPKSAILAELERKNISAVSAPDLKSSAAMARIIYGPPEQKTASASKAAKPGMRMMMAAVAAPAAGKAMAKADMPAPKTMLSPTLQMYGNEACARIHAAVNAQIGFVERLVAFWSNHFCVAIDKVGPMAGGFEREAIRPHVLGRFSDMLQAVEMHPAMLIYLDNFSSVGPNSTKGFFGQGLNENLAREIMELHTVGVRSGYTQEDVTNFAKVITGWTIVAVSDPRRGGEFGFDEDSHEPGPQTIWGKTYSQDGVAQGKAVLADLARHPATADHISAKFARHFVADDPPQPLVQRLADSFRNTDGDLKELAKTLVNSPEAWDAPRVKLKSPWQWIMSGLRTTGVEPVTGGVIEGLKTLGEPLWFPPAPNGFPDTEAAWLDGLSQRLDLASDYASRVADRTNPVALIDVALGPLASKETRQTIGFAGSRQQALTMLLLAPEFQRS